jgi:hypothetical protein
MYFLLIYQRQSRKEDKTQLQYLITVYLQKSH